MVMDENTLGRVVDCPNCGAASQVPDPSSSAQGMSGWAIGGLAVLLTFVLTSMSF
jgi:hypothetical protein